MIKYTSTIILLFFLFLVNAQETITITGQIIDQETQQILPFVSVSVNDETTNAIVMGTITDDNGRFEIKDLKTGKYTVNITYLGFEAVQRKIAFGGLNPIFDLGKIELKPSAEALDEVTIQAKRTTVNSALDKKTFSLDDNVAQSGGSVVDAMKIMPGVACDQDGKVVLRGSEIFFKSSLELGNIFVL
ncbi:carboxypeptidase-like regulatory domain-containing protein [Changchengzhania lutea]|uniref:carboxypeptidase-like regulatory domain-containing protein n=1 Tax=Changchengzhania lutea TaxID=2049305 RepID=UPI00115D5A77|nr:carboxypeptidase-like regulatory domain-containing protein [Changchengzhania lutea]